MQSPVACLDSHLLFDYGTQSHTVNTLYFSLLMGGMSQELDLQSGNVKNWWDF